MNNNVKKKKRKQDDKLAMNFPPNLYVFVRVFLPLSLRQQYCHARRIQTAEESKKQPKKIHQFIINNFYDHKFILLCVTYYVITVSSSSSMNLPILFSFAAEMK